MPVDVEDRHGPRDLDTILKEILDASARIEPAADVVGDSDVRQTRNGRNDGVEKGGGVVVTLAWRGDVAKHQSYVMATTQAHKSRHLVRTVCRRCGSGIDSPNRATQLWLSGSDPPAACQARSAALTCLGERNRRGGNG